MEEITVNDLYKYHEVMLEMYALQVEIGSLYYPIGSVPYNEVNAGKVSAKYPTDKTMTTVLMIDDRKNELKEIQQKNLTFLKSVQHYVDNIEDGELRSIVRMHFIAGKPWKETSLELYGKAEEANARIYFNRNKHKLIKK